MTDQTQEQVHPEIALQMGIPQEDQKQYDVHPSLQAELEPTDQAQEEVVAAQTATEPTEPPVIEKPAAEPNRDWRELRAQAERAKQAEREAEALARERDFYREQAMNKQKSQQDDEDYRTDSEKQLAHQMAELKQQVARQAQETENAKRQSAVARAEQRLAQDYPDIREIVTDENVKRLELEYPHLYNSVISSSDVYSVGSAAYEMILAKGIASRTNQATLNSIASAASPNRNKPRSVSTIAPQTGDTPIQRAGASQGMSISSEEERKALWAEMVGASRHRAF